MLHKLFYRKFISHPNGQCELYHPLLLPPGDSNSYIATQLAKCERVARICEHINDLGDFNSEGDHNPESDGSLDSVILQLTRKEEP